MIISKATKSVTKFNILSFMIKTLKVLGMERIYMNIMKAIYGKPRATVYYMGEN